MLFNKLALAASVFVSATVAKIIPIDVGKNGLTFTPNITTAAANDTLVFSFFPKNHTVTQGPFTSPCQVGDLTPSFFSGFMATTSESPTTFSVTVNNTDPIWIFCSQAASTHCQAGMVMVVNQPVSGPSTLEAYAAGAKKTNSSEIPFGGKAAGGVFATNNATSTSSTSTSTSATSTSSSTSSSTASPTSAANAMVSRLNAVVMGAVTFGAAAFAMAL